MNLNPTARAANQPHLPLTTADQPPFPLTTAGPSELLTARGAGFAELLDSLARDEALDPSRPQQGKPGSEKKAQPADRQQQKNRAPDDRAPLESLRAADLCFLPPLATSRPPAGEAQGPLELTTAQSAAQEILRHVAIHQVGTQTTLQLELEAARLSRISLQLQLDNGRLSARFLVEDEAGLGILRAAAGDLERALQEKGLTLGEVEFARKESAGGSAGFAHQQSPESADGATCEEEHGRAPAARRTASSCRPGDLVI